MSFVSKIIGTAERVPLPDLVIRAAVQRLCSRTATRLAGREAVSDTLFADEMAARAIAGYTDEAKAPHHELPTAFFARVRYRVLENKRRDKLDSHEFDGEQIVWQERAGEGASPLTGRALRPRFLGGPTPDLGPGNFQIRKLQRCRIRRRSANISSGRPRCAD